MALLYASIILLVLTWMTVLMRVCVRIWRRVLGMDDYLIILGLVSVYLAVLLNVELTTAGFIFSNGLSLYSRLFLWLWAESSGSKSSNHFQRNQGMLSAHFSCVKNKKLTIEDILHRGVLLRCQCGHYQVQYFCNDPSYCCFAASLRIYHICHHGSYVDCSYRLLCWHRKYLYVTLVSVKARWNLTHKQVNRSKLYGAKLKGHAISN